MKFFFDNCISSSLTASGGAEAVARMLADTFKAEGQGTQEDPRFVTNPVTIESWPTDTRNPASL